MGLVTDPVHGGRQGPGDLAAGVGRSMSVGYISLTARDAKVPALGTRRKISWVLRTVFAFLWLGVRIAAWLEEWGVF